MSSAAIYGHRGARGEAPENTMAGFAHALTKGVAGLETDIALTADLVPVLHHDPELADGRLIRATPFAALPGIPTLGAALAAFPHTNWLLEIKTFPSHPEKSHSPAQMVSASLNAVMSSGISPDRLTILAFDWSVLHEIARQAPRLHRACLTAPSTEAEPALWWGMPHPVSTPQAVAATGATAWAACHNSLTASNIDQARALGLKIYAWTVNDPEDVQRLAPLVDVIITDHPTRFIPPPR